MSGFDAVGPSASGATALPGTSLSYNHPVAAGANRVLLAVIAVGTSPDGSITTSATALKGGSATAMTPIGGQIHTNATTAGFMQVYGMINPDAGTNAVVLSCSVSTTLTGGSMSFNAADQVTGWGTPVTATGSSGIPSVVIATTAGNIVAGFAAAGQAITSATAPVTSRFIATGNTSSGAGNSAGGTAPSTGSNVTMAWSLSPNTDFWAALAVEVLTAPDLGSPLAWQYDLAPEQEDDGIDDGVPEWPPWFVDAGAPPGNGTAGVFIHPQSVRAKYLPGPLLARRVSQARSSAGPPPAPRPLWVRAPRTRTRAAPAQLPSVNVAAPPPSPPESPPPVPAARRGGFLGRPRHEAASAPLPPVIVPPPYPPGSVRPVRRWPLRRYASAPRAGTGPVPLALPPAARRVPEARVRRAGAAGPPVPPPVLPPAMSLSTLRRRLWLPRSDRGSVTVLPAPPAVQVPPPPGRVGARRRLWPPRSVRGSAVTPAAAPAAVPPPPAVMSPARRRVWLPRLARGSAPGPVPAPPAVPPPPSLAPATVRRRAGLPRGDRGSATVPVPPPPAGPPPVSWVPQAVRGPRRLMARRRPPAAPPAPARVPRTGAVSPRRPARGALWPRPRAAAPVPAQVTVPPAHYVPPAPRWRRLWRFLRRQPGIAVPPGVLVPPPPPPVVSAAGTAAGVPHGAWSARAPHGTGLGAGVPGGRWQTRGVSGTTAGAGPPRGSWSAASPHG